MTDPTHLVVGHVSKAHGTKGEVFIFPLTDSPQGVFAAGASLLIGDEDGELHEDGGELTVEQSREFKSGMLVKFDGYDDRDAVEELRGSYLLLPIDQVAQPGEDEVFYHELLGLEVVTEDGVRVGRVREVFETGPAHLLEVKSEDLGKVRLIPYTKQIIREVNLETRVITISPPEGLLEV